MAKQPIYNNRPASAPTTSTTPTPTPKPTYASPHNNTLHISTLPGLPSSSTSHLFPHRLDTVIDYLFTVEQLYFFPPDMGGGVDRTSATSFIYLLFFLSSAFISFLFFTRVLFSNLPTSFLFSFIYLFFNRFYQSLFYTSVLYSF